MVWGVQLTQMCQLKAVHVTGTGQSPGNQVSQMRHLRVVQVSGTGHLGPDPRAGQLRRDSAGDG